jgi:hypothetical protein
MRCAVAFDDFDDDYPSAAARAAVDRRRDERARTFSAACSLTIGVTRLVVGTSTAAEIELHPQMDEDPTVNSAVTGG